MASFHLTIMRPEGYLHSDAFREIAEGLYYSLRDLGHEVSFAENQIHLHVPTIVFGSHLLSVSQADSLPDSVILYNLEQLGHSYVPPWYVAMAQRLQVWDYAAANVRIWNSVGGSKKPKLLEVGYVRQLSRIHSAEEQDIDVLFYGSITERRSKVLDALRADGMRVEAAFGIYGAARDALIARSRLVLNLHAGHNRIFEIVRVSYLWMNKKAVVSEESDDTGGLANAVATCTCESAVEVCRNLLASDAARYELEQRGYDLFAARSQADILSRVLDAPDA